MGIKMTQYSEGSKIIILSSITRATGYLLLMMGNLFPKVTLFSRPLSTSLIEYFAMYSLVTWYLGSKLTEENPKTPVDSITTLK